MRRRAAVLCSILLLGGCSMPPQEAPRSAAARPAEDGAQGDHVAPGATGPEAQASSGDGARRAATTGDDEEHDDEEHDDGAVDDDGDLGPPPDATFIPPHPFAQESDADLERRLVEDRGSLGSISVGRPNGGRLVGGVQMPPGDGWMVVAPDQAWGTQETLAGVRTAIEVVRRAFPDTARLAIGDISSSGGGYLRPHRSHQSGRDVDLGYYYLGKDTWYRRANAQNLDTHRTWALVRALITETDVEMILIDHSLQLILREHGEKLGEDRDWLELIFRGRGGVPALIRHAPGHATHLHVRFYSPTAQETGRRLYPALVRHNIVQAGAAYFTHVVKKGETLGKLAKRYGTTERAIKRANGLRSSLIQARKAYKIPRTDHTPVSIVGGPVKIPPRRLPPGH